MSTEEVCASLDNTSVGKSGETFLKNYNSTEIVGEKLQNTVGLTKTDTKSQNVCPQSEMYSDTIYTEDNEEYPVDVMTGSYGEISFDQDACSLKNDSSKNRDLQITKDPSKSSDDNGDEQDSNDTDGSRENKRPNSLILQKSAQTTSAPIDGEAKSAPEAEEPWRHVHKSQQTSDSQTTSLEGSPSFSSEEYALYSSGHRRTGSDTSGLSELQGTLTVEGDMVSFVAEDLQEKIKMSSPVSRWAESPSFPGSRSSTPSLYRQALQPHVPVIDAGAVADLEVHARKVATCVDTMLENLSGTLQSISSLTVDCMETYEKAVCKTCDAVDSNIKSMYQLMAKCEELSNSMKPVYKISEEIKEIKRILDHFENVVEHKN